MITIEKKENKKDEKYYTLTMFGNVWIYPDVNKLYEEFPVLLSWYDANKSKQANGGKHGYDKK